MIRTLSILGRADKIHPQPGLRSFGVPPGGAWDVESWAVLQALGCEVVWETATTAFGNGSPFWAFESIASGTLYFTGTIGEVVRNGAAFRLPCRLSAAPGDRFEVSAGSSGMRLLVGASMEAGQDALLDLPPAPDEGIWFIPSTVDRDMEAVVSPRQDRIGIRLTGNISTPPALARSEPSVLGAIQLVEGGLLIHGPEGPTTGGYIKAGVVARVSLSRLAQARPGDQLLFAPVSVEEALLRREERERALKIWVNRIRVGLKVESERMRFGLRVE